MKLNLLVVILLVVILLVVILLVVILIRMIFLLLFHKRVVHLLTIIHVFIMKMIINQSRLPTLPTLPLPFHLTLSRKYVKYMTKSLYLLILRLFRIFRIMKIYYYCSPITTPFNQRLCYHCHHIHLMNIYSYIIDLIKFVFKLFIK